MNLNDKRVPAKHGKMPSSPIKAPAGNIKGIGPLGYFTGGLSPTVVKPGSNLPGRSIAATILRGGK